MRFDVRLGEPVVFEAEGDCCSESWFSDIYNFDALISTVRDVREIEMPDYNVDDGRGRQDSDSVYGYQIQTNKGTATVVFRNSSNGYYGGSLRLASYEPQCLWTPITGDWKA